MIGGLLLATFGTLTFVPAFFSLVHRNDRAMVANEEEVEVYS